MLDPVVLHEVRSAIAAGVSPGAALAAVGTDGVLAGPAQAVRLGEPLPRVAASASTGDPAADLLVRALAVAERTGAGAAVAVEQALASVRGEAELARLLRSKTAQARAAAKVMSVVPVVAWALLVLANPAALGLYRTPLGIASLLAFVALLGVCRRWSGRIVERAARAASAADPLAPQPTPVDRGRLVAVAAPATIAGALVGGPAAGLAAGAVAAVVAMRGRRRAAPPTDGGGAGGAGPDDVAGGAAEAVELVAVALAAGLPIAAAVAAVADLAPPRARAPLAVAARRLRGGWQPAAAFADGPLANVGRVLGVAERWGAPSVETLRLLAADLRADRRTAVEVAAERVQISLLFPTTLLTLPAFLVGVVPPLLWAALASWSTAS